MQFIERQAVSIVSGGRALHLPGISLVPKEENPPRKKWHPLLFILAFSFLFVLSLSVLVFLEYKNIELKEIQGAGPTDDGGYQLSKTVGAQWGIVWSGVAAIMIPSILGIYVAYKTRFGKKIVTRNFAPILCCLTLFIAPYFLSGTFVPESAGKVQSFSEWAKDKYDLSAIEMYTQKLVLKAEDQNNKPVELNVFKSADNVVYLYHNEDELRNILAERAAHNEKKN